MFLMMQEPEDIDAYCTQLLDTFKRQTGLTMLEVRPAAAARIVVKAVKLGIIPESEWHSMFDAARLSVESAGSA